jgi:N utilization substance protein A
MNREVVNLITQIARIRNVDVNYVAETLRQSLVSGLKRWYGSDAQTEVIVEPETGDIRIFLLKKVVLSPESLTTEIARDEAKKLKSEAKLGEVLRIEVPLNDIGRIAIRRAGDELMVKLREAEGTKLYEEFLRKKSEIVTGTVQRILKDEVVVNLGPVEGIIQLRDQLRTDHYRPGMPIKAYVHRVERTPIGPKVYLSRTHPEFLRKLLYQEVAEIQEGVVEIKGVARSPGVRAKVAVTSNDERVDPVGACIGYRKSRIQNVIKELGGEKLDIIPWARDLSIFIARALGPARVKEVFREGEVYVIVVPDEEFSIAIGKKGQNVWLASLLTQQRLEVLKESDYQARLVMNRARKVPLAKSELLPQEVKEGLERSGYSTLFDFLNLSLKEMERLTGLQIPALEALKEEVRKGLG